MADVIRTFDYEQDLADVKRIWKEVGWVVEDNEVAQLDDFFAVGQTWVAEVDGTIECSVHAVPADIQIHQTRLSMLAVTAVTTSHLGRGRAFAQRLTARQLARAQGKGTALAALGMFDQGFYDKLGFGTGGYEQQFSFDPAQLRVPVPERPAVRLTLDDSADMHACLLNRHRQHGSVSLHSPRLFRSELGFDDKAFGLGFRSDEGELTHFLWLDPGAALEHGPYRVRYMGYQEGQQCLELLGLLKSLSDQVYSVNLIEPADCQLQVMLDRPMRHSQVSRASEFASHSKSLAWWQARVLNLAPCVEALAEASDQVSFQVQLIDPLSTYERRAGLAGYWRVQLGPNAGAEPCTEGHTGLPKLKMTVNTMTRLLLGVGSASSLALSDGLEGDRGFLHELDLAIRVHSPVTGWDF